jgi:hypothetical protein
MEDEEVECEIKARMGNQEKGNPRDFFYSNSPKLKAR